MAFAPERFERFPEPPARMPVDFGVDGPNDIRIAITPTGFIVVGRPRQADATAAALHRQTMLGDQVRNSVTLLRRP